VKQIIQRQRRWMVAGDSAYPISEVCITPYLVAAAIADPTKSLFNRRHSGLRTVCTENIYGRWKRRWRCLKMLRQKHAWARETVIACAVLHNLAILWGEEDLEDDVDHEVLMPPPPAPIPVPALVRPHNEEPLLVRARGQNVRDALRLNMPRAGRA
jgi:hypothetical protein